VRIIRLFFASFSLLVIFSFSLSASPLTPEEQKALNDIIKNKGKREAAIAILNQPAAATAVDVAPSPKAAAVANAPARPINSNVAQQPVTPEGITTLLSKNEKSAQDKIPNQYSKCPGLVPLLRHDWNDIGIIAGKQCPDTVDKATGAKISFTNDRVANNEIWSVYGTAALIYNSITGNTANQITPYDTSAGAYVTVNRLTNSSTSQAKNNADTLAYGGVGELGFATSTGADYFQVRGGGVQDNIKGTTAAHIAGEWLPVYYPLHIHEPFTLVDNLAARFDPAFLVQYDRATGNNQLLGFNNRPEALRIGPQLALKVFMLPGAPDFLSRFTGSVSYQWAYEAYSDIQLNWFTTSISYNIDAAGHIGLTGSYMRGRDENTGALTNVYTIGLSGKI
jgi:hypothetical protein